MRVWEKLPRAGEHRDNFGRLYRIYPARRLAVFWQPTVQESEAPGRKI